jgi:hypothetical protein
VVRLGLGLMVVVAVLLACLTGRSPSATCCPSCCSPPAMPCSRPPTTAPWWGGGGASRGAVAGLLTLSRNLGQLTGAGWGPVRRPGGAARSPSRRRTSWRLPPGSPSP